MGRVSDSYNEAELCPRRMPMEWWYSLPSQMRTRIRNETGYMPEAEVTYIGEMQDRLIAKGLGRLMGTYMRAMQACLDRETAEREENPERVLHVNEVEKTAYLTYPSGDAAAFYGSPYPDGVVPAQPTFGFHEPRA